MKTTLLQSLLHWHSPEENRAMFSQQIADLSASTDLIVLPEMFTTGFSNATEAMAEEMDGPTVEWMKQEAAKADAVLCGSLMIRDVGGFYNRMLWVRPDGGVAHYDKRHLFSIGGEGDQFRAGREQRIVEYKGWRFCLQICYDLRFPVWSRNRLTDDRYDYDCLIYVANWPSPRASAWKNLLRARAIENVSYCIGVNRIGTDANGLLYLGDSVVLGPKGKDLCRGGADSATLTATLSRQYLDDFRQRFPVLGDADGFTID